MKLQRKTVSERWIISKLNDIPIHRKLVCLFVFCILLPLLITDILVLWMLLDYQKNSIRHDSLNAAEYYLTSTFEDAAGTARSIYLNKYINSFLNTDFESPLDYYNNYLKLLTDSLYLNSLRDGKFAITIHARNDSILNGGCFRKLDDQKGWYQTFEASGQNTLLLANYDDSHTVSNSNLRQVSLIRCMNYYLRDTIEKVVKVDISYSRIEKDLQAANYEADLYVCLNGQLVFSNVHSADLWAPFEDISPALVRKSRDVKSLNLYGCDLTIYAIDRSVDVGQFLYRNWLPLLLLVSLNLLPPSVFISCLNRSFIERLQNLTTTVKSANDGVMPLLEQVQGLDEIGMLMGTYNDMAQRMNLLIETVYKSRLREQETDLARQQAELLALRSQINPHFLFNVLESIRMQSLLKEEKKTAEMIGMLAYIERQYVDWGADVVLLGEELRSVEAYLRLQQYRLGDRGREVPALLPGGESGWRAELEPAGPLRHFEQRVQDRRHQLGRADHPHGLQRYPRDGLARAQSPDAGLFPRRRPDLGERYPTGAAPRQQVSARHVPGYGRAAARDLHAPAYGYRASGTGIGGVIYGGVGASAAQQSG